MDLGCQESKVEFYVIMRLKSEYGLFSDIHMNIYCRFTSEFRKQILNLLEQILRANLAATHVKSLIIGSLDFIHGSVELTYFTSPR